MKNEIRTRRLNKAFTELRAAGIDARERFRCCSSCALFELQDEHVAAGDPHRPFAFYHEQDAEDLDDGYVVHIRHGEDDATARKIVGVLANNELLPDWDGSMRSTITIAAADEHAPNCDWCGEPATARYPDGDREFICDGCAEARCGLRGAAPLPL